ncbi:MAG: [Ni/Fe] hydrogenase, small subunit MSMEG_2720, partial [uncultured Solirubrobacteraceae bacterium]
GQPRSARRRRTARRLRADPRALDDGRAGLRRRVRRDDVCHGAEPRGSAQRGDPRQPADDPAQPDAGLRDRRGLPASVVRRRGRPPGSVSARRGRRRRRRAAQRRGPLDRLRRGPDRRSADHRQRVDRPPGTEGGGGRRGRHLRDLRRRSRDEEQPDRCDGRAGLPRLVVAVADGPAGRLHPRLPDSARQHDVDPARAAAVRGRDRPGTRARRAPAPGQPVLADDARRLRARGLHRARPVRDDLRQRPALPRQARLQGPRGSLQRSPARLGQRRRRLPERRRDLHRLHDAGVSRQVHAVHGCRSMGQRGCELPALHVRPAVSPLPQAQPRAEVRAGAGLARAAGRRRAPRRQTRGRPPV